MTTALRVTKLITREFPGLGERIKRARMADPRPTYRIAADAGMSVQNWYRVEKEEHSLSLESVRKIEESLGIVLGVDWEDIDD